MNFSDQQIQGLNAAYSRQQSGGANATDQANLAYAQKNGWTPSAQTSTPTPAPVATPTAAPTATVPAATPAATPGSTVAGSQPSLEVKPGTFSASKLKDYYDNLGTSLKQQSEAYKNLQTYQAPDYQSLYNQSYTASVKPLETQISDVTGKINAIDDSLRNIEQDVRNEIGGRASESIIRAEVARRAAPLENQRQGLVSQYNAFNTQRQQALDSVQTQLGLAEKTAAGQLSSLQMQAQLADNVVSQFQTLVEKGEAASEKEKDNFRQMFSTLLQQSPDVLRNLTQDELSQLGQGYVPVTVMQKIGSTISEQKLAQDNAQKDEVKKATAGQILTRAYQLQQLASDQGQSLSTQEAIAQAQAEYDFLNGTSTGGSGLNTSGTPSSTYTGSSDAQSIANAIKQIESGGNYQAKGASGESGAYQFMPSSWSSWAKQYLGDANAPMTAANQDKVATAKIQSLLDQGYDARQVALIWNGGQPVEKKGVNSKGVAYDSGAYADKVIGVLGKSPKVTKPTNQAPAAQVTQSFDDYIKQKEAASGMSFTPAKRQQEYNNYLASQKQATTAAVKEATGNVFEPVLKQADSKFTPQFYSTKLGQKTKDDEMAAKKSFESNQIVKDFIDVQSRVAEMQKIIDSGVGGPADLNSVFVFMKALDPNSVVRETEFDNAAKSGNIFNGIWAKFNGYFKDGGGFLPDSVKNDFLTLMKKTLESKTATYNNYASQTRNIAKTQGMNPDNVAIEFKIDTSGLKTNSSGGSSSGKSSDPLGIGVSKQSDPLGIF